MAVHGAVISSGSKVPSICFKIESASIARQNSASANSAVPGSGGTILSHEAG